VSDVSSDSRAASTAVSQDALQLLRADHKSIDLLLDDCARLARSGDSRPATEAVC
jgi:hypothetical protein